MLLTEKKREARWTIPAEIGSVSPRVVETAGFLERCGIGSKPLFTSQLLLEEIVSNVVRHGVNGGTSEIRVQVTLDPEQIRLVVEDDARPFDPFTQAPVPDTTADLMQRPEGGLGILLVKRMADELVYERSHSGNRVRMRVELARD